MGGGDLKKYLYPLSSGKGECLKFLLVFYVHVLPFTVYTCYLILMREDRNCDLYNDASKEGAQNLLYAIVFVFGSGKFEFLNESLIGAIIYL